MHTCDVLVVGAGPTGLMLAGELALAGVGVQVLERRREAPNITRAFAVHAAPWNCSTRVASPTSCCPTASESTR